MGVLIALDLHLLDFKILFQACRLNSHRNTENADGTVADSDVRLILFEIAGICVR